MKKVFKVVSLLLLLMPLLYLSLNKEEDITNNIALASEINSEVTEFKYVLVGNKTCAACKEYAPIITKAMKEVNTKVYYLDNEELENEIFLKEKNVNVTPTLLVLDKENKIVSRYEGVIRFEETIKILKGES